jgi:hypothetical protein
MDTLKSCSWRTKEEWSQFGLSFCRAARKSSIFNHSTPRLRCWKTNSNYLSPSMGKKRPAAGDRGDAPKRFKEGAQRNGGPPREKSAHKKADVNGKKQKIVLVGISIGNDGSPC